MLGLKKVRGCEHQRTSSSAELPEVRARESNRARGPKTGFAATWLKCPSAQFSLATCVPALEIPFCEHFAGLSGLYRSATAPFVPVAAHNEPAKQGIQRVFKLRDRLRFSEVQAAGEHAQSSIRIYRPGCLRAIPVKITPLPSGSWSYSASLTP